MSWEAAPLDQLLEVQNGYAFDSKKFTPEKGWPLIRIRDLKEGTGTEVNYSGEFNDDYIVNAGDLLIGMDGEFRCYDWKGPPALLNQRVCRLRNFSGLTPRFLMYGINKYLEEIEAATSFTTVKHLSSKTIKAIEFPHPPLPEQQRIVGKLDAAFSALTEAQAHVERNRANARELFESYLNGVFEGKGDGWKEYTLPDIAENLDSRRVPITKGDRKAGQYPYYGASGIVDYVHDYIFDEECLLISEDGANLLMRSTPIAFSVSGKYWVNNHAHILRFREKATQSLVEHYLESIDLDPWITGAAQPKLNQSAMNSIPIWLPVAIEARQALVEKLDDLKSETDALEATYQQKLAELAGLKKAVLGAAFRGEL